MKKTLLFLCLLAMTVMVQAGLKLDEGKPYRISCTYWGINKGGLSIGTYHDSSIPLYYYLDSTTSDDQYWYLKEESDGQYSIQNSVTNQYITYTGVRDESTIKYIELTESMLGTASLWTITESGDYYVIRNVSETSHVLNVRTNGTYLVGSYANLSQSGGNELFQFYDVNGVLVDNSEVIGGGGTPSTEGSYGVTDEGYFWENTGLNQPFVYTTDLNDPVYYYIQNSRSKQLVAVVSSSLLEKADMITKFYFVKGSDGTQIYTSDGQYVSGKVSTSFSTIGSESIYTQTGTTSTNDNTWTIAPYLESSYPGYTISIKTCSLNSSSTTGRPGGFGSYTPFSTGYTYWNDYTGYGIIGFYTAPDDGNQFILLSNDQRHKEYLAENGISIQGGSVTSGAANKYFDTLYVNNKKAVYDSYNKCYMVPVKNEYRGGKSMTSTIKFVMKNEGNFSVKINDEAIVNGGEYTFESVDGTATSTVDVYLNDTSKVGSSPIVFTFLPIVEMTGSTFSSSYYNDGTIVVNDPDNAGLDSMYFAGYRYRGATASGLPKKSYAVKIRDAEGNSLDHSFFGLRDDNNWILDAMGIDPGRMRNRVSTDIWNEFSKKPYYATKEPKLINGTRGRFVEVLLNGAYLGLYCMTEKLDRKQLKLKKIQPAATEAEQDTIRGVLYKSSSWGYTVFMGHENDNETFPLKSPTDYDNDSETWAGSWEIKYPDLGDGERIDWKPLWDVVNFVATSDAQGILNGAATYFDLPVMKDYYLFIELMLATDNHGKNMFYYNYNTQKYTKFSIAPWDLDGTWGRRWDGSTSYTKDATQDFVDFLWNYEHGEMVIYKRLMECDYEGWNNQLKDRYAELRNTLWTKEKLYKKFSDYADLFQESGAEARESKRWSPSGYFHAIGIDNERDYLQSWINDRIDALDERYTYEPPVAIQNISDQKPYLNVSGGQGNIMIHADKAQTVKVFNTAGLLVRTINAKQGISTVGGFQPGVYIVNDNKVLIK